MLVLMAWLALFALSLTISQGGCLQLWRRVRLKFCIRATVEWSQAGYMGHASALGCDRGEAGAMLSPQRATRNPRKALRLKTVM